MSAIHDFLTDTKNILLGKVGEDDSISFKQELERCIKNGTITKEEATILMKSVKDVKDDANEMDKKQIASISLEDGSVVESEEETKKKKAELERKKRAKEQVRQAQVQAANNVVEKKENKENKTINSTNRLKVDRDKLKEAIQKAEREEKIQNKNIERDGKN